MKPAGQMTLSLTRELEAFVREEVKRGAFASSSEYVRNLVREKYLDERARRDRLHRLDEAIARGIADADAGRSKPAEEVFARIRRDLDLEPSRED